MRGRSVTEQFETCSKKVRGMARKSLELIEAMAKIAEDAHPITGRGVGYKLFTAGLIPSMATQEMQRVYRLLRQAREQGTIEWDWIVDETREFERTASWNNPEEYAAATIRDYRRDYWDHQPVRCEVWSEKGTVRGVVAPVLDAYGVGFRVMHGFSSATTVHNIAEDNDGRPLVALYVGDWDPSGLFMSECDLPARLERYDGDHVEPVVHHGSFQPKAGATLRRIKGQKFRANKGRSLAADERRAVEANLRERGILQL